MQLIPDWRRVLRYAYSVRWIAVAGLLTAGQVALPYFDRALDIPDGIMAWLTLFCVSGAFVSRLTSQKAFKEQKNDEPEWDVGK